MPEKYIKAADCEKYFYEHLDDVHIAAAMNAIDEIPTADVSPVRHGYWKRELMSSKIGLYGYICSNCNKLIFVGQEKYMTYCGNCGAKMDEKECEENEV